MKVLAKADAKALKEDTKDPSTVEWDKYQKDKQTLGWIKRYLKGSPLLLIKDCRTAYEAWEGILVKKYSVGDEDIDFDDLKLKMDVCKLKNDKNQKFGSRSWKQLISNSRVSLFSIKKTKERLWQGFASKCVTNTMKS